MNRLKSLFISAFLTIVFVFTVIEVIQIFGGGNKWLLGLSMALPIFILLLFAKFFLFKAPRTSENFPLLSAFFLSLYIGAGVVLALQDQVAVDLIAYNTISILGWFAYLKWYSVFPDRNRGILAVGNDLPGLKFKDTNGDTVTSEDFKGSKTIYLFYRGNWCPLCMAQIKEIADQYQELSRRGVKMVLVSPQPQRHTKSLARKFDVPFIFLRDENNEVAKQLNIFQQAGTPFGLEVLGYESDTVMPTVIICDEQGKIILADLTDNYRVRPEPSAFLEVLDSQP